MKIKSNILEKLTNDKLLIALIADSRKVTFQTVERWCNDNHENLLHIGTLLLIAKQYKMNLHLLYTIK